MILHLGVADVPYSYPGRTKRSRKVTPGTTTGDVAEILEAKYHVMENFFQVHSGRIARDLENSLKGALENLLLGSPAPTSPFNEGTAKIEDSFKKFLSMRGMEKLGYPGVPTQAALDGVNHRLSHPNAKANKRRPSFIDTGLYQSSFKAWVDMDTSLKAMG